MIELTPPFGLIKAMNEDASDFSERYLQFFRDAVENAHNHHDTVALVYTDHTVYSHGGYTAACPNEKFYEFCCHHFNDPELAKLADIVIMRPEDGPERVVVDHSANLYSDEIYHIAQREEE